MSKNTKNFLVGSLCGALSIATAFIVFISVGMIKISFGTNDFSGSINVLIFLILACTILELGHSFSIVIAEKFHHFANGIKKTPKEEN